MAKLKDKHVVIGLGKTGLSCVRFLRRLECPVAVVDTRAEPPAAAQLRAEFPDVTLLTGPLDKFDFTGCRELVVSPGLSLKHPAINKAIAAGVPYAGDVDLFARSVDAPVIAVTGSNGKSTVVTLLGKALEALGYNTCVAGNIGLPVLDALSKSLEVEVWVLELSSFQLETTHSLQAGIAVNLNVSADHLDRYDGLDDYAMAKQRIFDGCEAAVYWIEDHRTKPAQPVQLLLPFGGDENDHGRFYVVGDQLMDGSRVVLNRSELHLQGRHNLLNICACLTVLGQFAGTDYRRALPAIKAFSGLPHRCEWVAEIDGVRWINDSKGTNLGSTVAAIEGLVDSVAGTLLLIAGGEGKGADFSSLRPVVAASVGRVILFGRDRALMAEAIGDAAAVVLVETLQQAVAQARASAQAGDVVLFSPACASFDQFENYEDRGRQFVAAVAG
ncbi:MAG: UDP-N-acetylmuramoyl-L-alanine--D-glutamate ligase [Pseudomonadota bacterium]|nr:UDP-N-acetylmuramoyl-L-alanine--D-glutamate ligase [Pseudomonadota bacterium]